MKQRKIIRLVQARNERKAAEARNVRENMFAGARAAAADHGDDIAGFALVSWRRDGGMHTSIFTGYGPVADSMVPMQVHDALQRHLTIEIAERAAITSPFDYEPDAS